MALPRSHQPLHLQQQQLQPSKSFRNLYGTDCQISPAVAYCNLTSLQDESFHPPYIPPHRIDGGVDIQWNYGLEPKKKRRKEQDFLKINSPISSLDFTQVRSVSTEFGLSLDNTCMTSSGNSALMSLNGEEINCQLQRHDAEISRFRTTQKLREKEAELEGINKKNVLLEERTEQLIAEANALQQHARYNESINSALKFKLQVYAQSRDSKEGCSESELDNTASCCSGRSIDFHLLCEDNNGVKAITTCKACRVN